MHDFFQPGRAPVLAPEAMVATSHPLASAAGLSILRGGGNAVDAAIGACATLCVVEAHMTGIGGDCFALYAPAGGEIIALNGSGRAPAAASIDALYGAGLGETIPRASPHAVTVPGAIAAWAKLHRDHGKLPFERLFRDAISYAENGYPVAARVAQDWAAERDAVSASPAAAAVFLKSDGTMPAFGERHRQPLLGARLREIAREGAGAFYTGQTAERMVAFLRSLGGLHTLDDFADAVDGATYETPIRLAYRGYDVYECPPNGQGVAALMILNTLSAFDLGPDTCPADRAHLHAEATKLAYHHRDVLIGDPRFTADEVERLLSDEARHTLAARVDMLRAAKPRLWTEPEHKDTIYLCVVDGEGNAISFINSIFNPFGSTLMAPDTGILLHNRGASFRLAEGHPNAIAGGKRPMHTIIPGMLAKDGQTISPFGVMGGHYQAAGHAAFLSGVIDRGQDVQGALDAPRSFAFGGVLEVEPTLGEVTIADLAARGHKIAPRPSPLGGGQAIWIDRENGVLAGGSDQRKDGCAIGF
ncbi:gamma-glutamyltransferase family protein [Aureimonas mangrovi]|uniref:gamma-glutamyltransferase family protein n=1 Tax=Aureimonas mangrovi TaxID=2758041 RepID=UPI00163D4C3E|nr:gamma-glutamyltransferase family protein [Aureimonas mangrovi]